MTDTAAVPGTIDAGRWPDVVREPHVPIRAAVAREVLRGAVRDLGVRVRLPDGRLLGAGGPDAPELRIESGAFFHRLGADLKIGFGEAYLAGDWQTGPGTDLADLLTVFAARLTELVPASLQRLRKLVEQRPPAAEDNDREGALGNIQRHYDLSNELFAAFLDETMSYSAGWFAPGVDDLATAQRHKVDGILDLAAVGPGSRVLEIGTGWGQLALQAGRRGATVHTVTLSAEQRDLAQRRFREAGLADRVTVRLCDYRDVTGRYDAVVSVEMIEAVGERYWPAYFAAVGRLLVPGGRFGLQAITMPHDRMLATRHARGWVHKYVFPGGLIPSLTAIEAHSGAAGFAITARRSLGPDYARTLRLWRAAFVRNAGLVDRLGFDAVFRRLWELYLAYSEAGFRSGYLDVWQLALRREG
ncbi:MAG: class I SAM-dependent methyltransferase [Kribbellaceae bacterium]